MESQLRHAIDNDELELYYQPKVNIATGRITGFEELVRWNHPKRGLLLPGEFIALAEDTGLIVPLSDWVLHTASRQAKKWADRFPEIGVAVNLSGMQFQQADVCRDVEAVLHEAQLDPRHLELEITESVIMRDAGRATEILEELSKPGVKITIDDFGTGYSSLSYLRSFPVDSFKIDRSFLTDCFPTRVPRHFTRPSRQWRKAWDCKSSPKAWKRRSSGPLYGQSSVTKSKVT